MREAYIYAAALGVMVVMLGAGVALVAQVPPAVPPAAAPAAAKALDREDALTVQLVATAAQFANAQCQGLDSVKSYQALIARMNTDIETKHPGQRMDWTTGKLVAKVVTPAK